MAAPMHSYCGLVYGFHLKQRQSVHTVWRCDSRQGMLHTATGTLEQPNVEERERAMGLPTGATAAPGLSKAARHSLTGRSIDLHCLVTLLHITAALSVTAGLSRPVSANPIASALPAPQLCRGIPRR